MEHGRLYLKRSAIQDVYVPWVFCIITLLSKRFPHIVVYVTDNNEAEYWANRASNNGKDRGLHTSQK